MPLLVILCEKKKEKSLVKYYIFTHCVLQPDDVEGKIREIIPAGFTCNTDDFVSLLEKEANFKPFGTLLHTYTVHSEEAGQLTYQIHKVQT